MRLPFLVSSSARMAWLRSLLIAVLAYPWVTSAYSDKGVVYLDELTFYKVIDGSKHVLLRFDKEYAWGDDHNQFKDVAEKISSTEAPMLVVSMPVSKREGEPKEIPKAFDVHEKDFPVYKLWRKGMAAGRDPPVNYTGSNKKADTLLAWVSSATGLFFGVKGQVESLHLLAQQFQATDSAEHRTTIMQQAQEQANQLAGAANEHAQYYLKVMTKSLDKADFPVTEDKRLRKVLEDKSVTEAKREGFQHKINILSSFISVANADKAEL